MKLLVDNMSGERFKIMSKNRISNKFIQIEIKMLSPYCCVERIVILFLEF